MRTLLCAIVTLAAAGAHAHIGAVVATPVFSAPPPPAVTRTDGGVSVAPYTFASADASYTVAWSDGDLDPTGKLFFYYLPSDQPYPLSTAQLKAMATPIPGADTGIFVSCTCAPDAGVVCDPNPVRDCRNSFVWDTSALAAGAYWVVAVNEDPPYSISSTARAPIRVAHGAAALPPALVVLQPDGFGIFDTRYRLAFLPVGQAPFSLTLAFGQADLNAVGAATPLTVPVTANGDGTWGATWDVSALAEGVWFVRAAISDAAGATQTWSHAGVTVFHGALVDDAGAADLATPGIIVHDGGCACDVRRAAAGSVGFSALLATMVLGAALWRTLRRRSR